MAITPPKLARQMETTARLQQHLSDHKQKRRATVLNWSAHLLLWPEAARVLPLRPATAAAPAQRPMPPC